MHNQMDRSQRDLLDESHELHRDAMRATHESLADLVDYHHDVVQQSHGVENSDESLGNSCDAAIDDHHFGRDAVVAGSLAAGLVALATSGASASPSRDIQMLQTQASLENLAVATYGVALTLPFIGGHHAIPLVKSFVTQTKAQHTEHAAAFNAAIKQLKGKIQTQPDPVLLKVVNQAKPSLTTPAAVVALAIELETGAAATYVKNSAIIADPEARAITASIMGVEAQHVAILLAVQGLIGAGDASMITLPPPLAKLPGVAGSIGFPTAFFSISSARPATEGAVN